MTLRDIITDRRDLGAYLVGLRTRAGWSRAWAAVQAGVAPQTWQQVEEGTRAPDVEELAGLLHALDVDEDTRGEVAALALAVWTPR